MKFYSQKNNLFKFTFLLTTFFFIVGTQVALSNVFFNSNNNICNSSDDLSKNDLKCMSHCTLEMLNDCNPENFVDVSKQFYFLSFSNKKPLNLIFLEVEPKSNSPPFFIFL